MERRPAWYSVIQYSPDPVRGEALNVGVVLLSPEDHFLDIRVARSLRRIHSAFGRHQSESLIRMALQSFSSRLSGHFEEFPTPRDLDAFAATMGNDLRLLPCRPAIIKDPVEALAELGQRVFEGAELPRVQQTLDRFHSTMSGYVRSGKVQKNYKMDLPGQPIRFQFDYKFVNGATHLVQALPMEHKELREAHDSLAAWTSKGRLLTICPEPLKLTLVLGVEEAKSAGLMDLASIIAAGSGVRVLSTCDLAALDVDLARAH